MGKLRLNLQHFAEQTAVEPGETLLKNKHIGIIEKVTAKHSYSSPAIISNDAIFMEGRSFTVLKGDITELKDYERNTQNEWDHPQIQETTYFLDQEKYWGRFATLARNKAKHLTLGSGADAQYDAVLDVSVELDEINASQNRVLFVSPSFYKGIKKFVIELPQGDTQQRVLGKGIQGELDGFLVVKVPTKFLQGVQAMGVIGEVLASPIQADLAKMNSNIPGMFGTLVEQLIYTGAFVPQHLQKFIYTIGGTEVQTKRDGIDAHAKEVRTEDTGA
ncbi:sugar-binding protein [Staphylococcus xylosus]